MDEERRLRADTCTLGKNVVKHNNPALHPDDWGVNITFIDNQLTSGQANAIYVDSVQSFDNSFNDTFCWNGWFYMNSSEFQENCNSRLRSSPTYVNYTGPLNYTIDQFDSLVEFINGPAYTYDQPSTLSSPILVDCSSDYTNQSSLLYIHPLQFPVIRLTIHFRYVIAPDIMHCKLYYGIKTIKLIDCVVEWTCIVNISWA